MGTSRRFLQVSPAEWVWLTSGDQGDFLRKSVCNQDKRALFPSSCRENNALSTHCHSPFGMEHNGDVYSCDHFVEPRHRLGNMQVIPLTDLAGATKQQRFGRAKRDTLPRACRECPVLFACHGGCPKDRFLQTPDGEPGLNYLCAGYKAFFTHVDTPMRRLSALVQQGRPTADVMTLL
jgi:uncharacterized protein